MRLLRWPLTEALDIGRADRFKTAATNEPSIVLRETRSVGVQADVVERPVEARMRGVGFVGAAGRRIMGGRDSERRAQCNPRENASPRSMGVSGKRHWEDADQAAFSQPID